MRRRRVVLAENVSKLCIEPCFIAYRPWLARLNKGECPSYFNLTLIGGTKETAEDEAVNETIQKAAVEAAASTAQGDVTPEVIMREGHGHFAAVPKAGAEGGKEPISTEADIVTPTMGTGAGDRLVDPKQAKPTKAKKASGTESAQVSTPTN